MSGAGPNRGDAQQRSVNTERPEMGRHAPLLLRIRETAFLLAMSERAVWQLIRTGELRPVRPPGMRTIRIARDDAEALVARWRAACPEIPRRSV